MPIAPGIRLGPYEIQAAIGAGGMGEVYKARNTRLGGTLSRLTAEPLTQAGRILGTVAWARDGSELFYVRGSEENYELIAHDVGPDGTAAPEGRPLFRLGSIPGQVYHPVPGYDVTPDGRRFVFVRYPTAPLPPLPNWISFVQNWFEELKAKVPAR